MLHPPIGIALFLGLFFAIGFGILGWGGYSVVKAQRAKSWPITDGKISSCDLVKSSHSEGGPTYEAKVTYTYWANGQNREGSRIGYGYSGSSNFSAHQAIFEKLRQASTVQVRYNPAKPSESVLSCGINRSTVAILVFSSVWTIFTTGFALLMYLGNSGDNQILQTLITK